ncbi:hypothetical protein QKW52_15020 [Bacillus sonorensis]|nr:hypothetical protein [Bacillus sonorensis]
MKFQKTAVSLLSASALVFSAAGAASAQEKAPQSRCIKCQMLS